MSVEGIFSIASGGCPSDFLCSFHDVVKSEVNKSTTLLSWSTDLLANLLNKNHLLSEPSAAVASTPLPSAASIEQSHPTCKGATTRDTPQSGRRCSCEMRISCGISREAYIQRNSHKGFE